MASKEITEISKKTEEVQDIIDRMPSKTPRIVASIVISLASLLLFFGWAISYPESVTGVVTITAQMPPVRLIAPTSGKLHLLKHKNGSTINGGEIIAVIESGADFNNILLLDSLLQKDIDELTGSEYANSESFILGELTIPYLKMQNSIQNYRQYKSDNIFIPRVKQLKLQKIRINKQLKHLNIQLSIQQQQHAIYTQNLYKDSIMFYTLKSTKESEYLGSKTTWLNSLQSIKSYQKEKDLAANQINEIEAQITQLNIEERQYARKLLIDLHTTHHELKSQMSQWKQKYVFIAPYTGKLEMLNFWKEKMFVQAGSEVFAIVPGKNYVHAQMLIPSQGAGKVKDGQEVVIKLDNFPYLEYGSINGVVSSISMLTNQSDKALAQKNINTYLVTVNLPQQLITNYDISLGFNHDMKGMAQILVKKRRLIERLFDNIKYIANEK